MDPELKRQLEEIHALAKDNHRMLRAVRRHQLIGTFGKFIFWVIVLGGTAFWFQTYVQPLVAKYSISQASNPLNSLTSTDLGKLINSLKAGK